MAKRDKKVVVNEVWLRLIQRKAELLDEMAPDVGVQVYAEHIKTLAKIQKDWDKAEAYNLDGYQPYTEPKE